MKSSARGPFGGRKDGIRCLRQTIAFVFVVRLLVIVGVGGYHESEIPTLITSMEKQHFVLPFMQMDQCMLQPEQLKIHSYGLLFRLPNGFFCPQPGLLICYRSQLDPKRMTNGLTVAKPYQVRNHRAPAQQEIANKCCELNPADCAIMHGIRVSTTEDRKNMTLELSITDSNYVLPNNFWINFGQKSNLRTFIRYDDAVKEWLIRREYAIERERHNEFMNNKGHGATMQQFVGLWLLGLDILPMEFVKELDLFVYRDCNCPIQAWFTHPTDLVDPGEIPLLEFGSKECKINNTVEGKAYPIGEMKTDEIIKIWFSPIADTESVEIVMVKTENNQTILSLTVYNENITYHGENWDFGLLPSEELLPTGWNIRVEIHMHKYSYEVYLWQNDYFVTENNNFWPTEGMPKELKDVTILVKANAIMGRVEKGQIDHRKHLDFTPKLPLSLRLGRDVTNGSKIRIHGLVQPNAKEIEINLMHDAPEWHEYIGATCLQIHVDFVKDTINMSTYHSGLKWHYNNSVDNVFFKQGEAFDLVIVIHKYKNESDENINSLYNMKVNGQGMTFEGDMPIWAINWYWIRGDMELLTLPNLKELDFDENKPNIFKHELEHLFMNGEELCISGKSVASFQIYLFHEANEEDTKTKIGDMLLKMDFKFNEEGAPDKLILKSKIYQPLTEYEESSHSNKLFAGLDFSIVIKAERTNVEGNENSERNQYKIVIQGGEPITYPNPKLDLEDTRKIPIELPPSWSVNWLTIDGNVNDIKIGKETGKCEGQKPLPPNIKQVDPNTPLAIGDKITIKGKIKTNGLHISINFFREAVEWDPIIGQTVMQANFTTENVEFDTFYDKKWKAGGNFTYQLEKKFSEGNEFVMVVEVMKEYYDIQIGSQKCNYTNKWMPYWAIQYVVVNGDLEANNDSPFIQIDVKVVEEWS